jgi:hypothetical protein
VIRPGRLRRALAVALAVGALGACGVSGGEADRHRAEAATCETLLRRAGRDPGRVDPARFADELAALRATGRPWSTIEPFVRACRSFG